MDVLDESAFMGPNAGLILWVLTAVMVAVVFPLVVAVAYFEPTPQDLDPDPAVEEDQTGDAAPSGT